MKRSIPLLFVGLAFVAGSVMSADAQQKAPKIGFVDLQQTLNQTAAGKKAKKKLEADKKKKQNELDKKQKALQKFAAELEKQRMVLKPDALRKRERELQTQYVALQEMYMKLQGELAKMEAKLVRQIFLKASPLIKQIADEKGFTLIIEKNEGAVLYGDKAFDITPLVNKRIR